MALKPPFSSLYGYPGYRGSRPSHGVTPSTVFPTHGYRGAALGMPCSGNILPWRRLDWAMPSLGDASSWRRLIWATLLLRDASPWRCLRLVSPHVDFDLDADFDLDFVNARVRDGTTFKIHTKFQNLFHQVVVDHSNVPYTKGFLGYTKGLKIVTKQW